MSFLIIIVNSYFIVGDKKIKISLKEHKKKREDYLFALLFVYLV